ncbi:hypothetical protein IEO21_03579 [Rhodonia placenta]|uniref:T6SS Phospholipase effector Tle1-like catalytic domain-containing protein n=1 Tax=Rhodonia placenta TaxID=104341 RepID=A0A8H7U441_9APHY|nr:hypothetical protein IEO21_03579 [Postia placenta]
MTFTTETNKPRTLILCFDGTADQFSDTNTNVVKLYSLFKKEESEQLCYYQPGIGTYLNDGVVSPFFEWGAKILDQGVAWYLDAHVRGGYQFLMQNYRPGDKICIFGFSRGAYTARALAGMLHKASVIGLLPKNNPEQIPFAYKLYKHTDAKSIELANGFKRTFCREVKIEFVGVWDTVASVGMLVSRTLPFIANNTTIKTFRHALSLDEHRAKFRPNLYHRPDTTKAPQTKSTRKQNTEKPADKGKGRTFWPFSLGNAKNKLTKRATKRTSTDAAWSDLPSAAAELRWGRGSADEKVEKLNTGADVLEVWFAGCHCDVGGSAVTDDTKLSLADITLHWMVRQIVLAQCGIVFDREALLLAGIPASPLHDQLWMAPLWWVLEILPTSYNWQEHNGRWHTSLHLGQGRHLPPHPNFHITVKHRMDEKSLRYRPRAIWTPGTEVYVE